MKEANDSLDFVLRQAFEDSSWDPANDLIGARLKDKYQILSQIGRGGMGTVFKAEHIGLNRFVAIKVLNGGREDEMGGFRRFVREARLAGSLNHANIVPVHDFDVHQHGKRKLPFLVMEYVDGISLKDLLQERGRIGVAESAQIVGQVLKAIQVTHNAGIVHRDLKPGNIMLMKSGDGWLVKLTDFGLGKDIASASAPVDGEGPTQNVGSQSLTGMNAMPGTPEYMSPEQFDGKPADNRSDIYAIGIILYQMLSGRVPFKSADHDILSLMVKHKSTLPMPINHYVGGVPMEFEQVVRKALEKRPERRFQTACDMHIALNRSVRQAASKAKPPSRTYGIITIVTVAMCAAGYLAVTRGALDRLMNKVDVVVSETRRLPPAPSPEPVRIPPKAVTVVPVRVPDPPAPPSIVATSFVEAKRLADHDRYSEAAAMLESLTKDRPRDPEVWYLLGSSRARLGQSSEATAAYRQFLKYGSRRDIRHSLVKAKIERMKE